MELMFENEEFPKNGEVSFDGTEITEIVMDGVTVWERQSLPRLIQEILLPSMASGSPQIFPDGRIIMGTRIIMPNNQVVNPSHNITGGVVHAHINGNRALLLTSWLGAGVSHPPGNPRIGILHANNTITHIELVVRGSFAVNRGNDIILIYSGSDGVGAVQVLNASNNLINISNNFPNPADLGVSVFAVGVRANGQVAMRNWNNVLFLLNTNNTVSSITLPAGTWDRMVVRGNDIYLFSNAARANFIHINASNQLNLINIGATVASGNVGLVGNLVMFAPNAASTIVRFIDLTNAVRAVTGLTNRVYQPNASIAVDEWVILGSNTVSTVLNRVNTTNWLGQNVALNPSLSIAGSGRATQNQIMFKGLLFPLGSSGTAAQATDIDIVIFCDPRESDISPLTRHDIPVARGRWYGSGIVRGDELVLFTTVIGTADRIAFAVIS